jgi:predicted RNase H-like HicB family nuclease
MSNRHEISATENRDRPFDGQVVEQAQNLAALYQVRIERDSRGYLGKVVDLPTIIGFGTSEETALRTTREHLKWALAYLIETGRTPSPSNSASR